MAKRRARLTDDVLDGFEQFNQSESQQVKKSGSQKVNKLTSQDLTQLAIHPAKLFARQEEEETSPPPSEPTQKLAEEPETQQVNKSTRQHVDNTTRQQVNKPTLRKSTFQISQSVFEQLESLHLQLQLELGKANTPYKEVIVEEAIARLLVQMTENKAELLEALQLRQQNRK